MKPIRIVMCEVLEPRQLLSAATTAALPDSAESVRFADLLQLNKHDDDARRISRPDRALLRERVVHEDATPIQLPVKPKDAPDTSLQDDATLTPLTPSPVPLDYSALAGDGIADDTAALQHLIDTAVARGISRIELPAGVYRTTSPVELYGRNLTFTGVGDATVIQVDHHFRGAGHKHGWGLFVRPVMDMTHYFPSAAVQGDVITFTSAVPFAPGDTLLLSNGRGSAMIEKRRLGGESSYFNELGPVEHVDVLSVTARGDGTTVVRLTRPVIGTGEYTNVLPAGTTGTDRHLHVRRVITPADGIVIENLAFNFTDWMATLSVDAHDARNLTLRNLTVLNEPTIIGGSFGGINVVSTTGAVIENVRSSNRAGIALNSTRNAVIRYNTVSTIRVEEATTDTQILHNTVHAEGTIGIRTGDMLCVRILIAHNTITNAAKFNGAIGIWEGRDIVVEHNYASGGQNSIWVNRSANVTVRYNQAGWFNDYGGKALAYENTWGVK